MRWEEGCSLPLTARAPAADIPGTADVIRKEVAPCFLGRRRTAPREGQIGGHHGCIANCAAAEEAKIIEVRTKNVGCAHTTPKTTKLKKYI